MKTILAVDDHRSNLDLIDMYCSDEGYTVLQAHSGEEGWQLLQTHRDAIDVVLLDRVMPGMNGIEFMGKLTQSSEVKHIPVIMQTASVETTEVAEGIDAGVYYYLTKPYDKQVLLSLLHAAERDYSRLNELKKGVSDKNYVFDHIHQCKILFKTLNEANILSTQIAYLFPNPRQVVYGLSELMINAVEHGNLGISYDEKSELMKSGRWIEEIQQREADPNHKDKTVVAKFERHSDRLTISIEDEGQGFEYSKYLTIAPERATHFHGRGIAMSNTLSFDQLAYQGKGNKVVCSVFI